MENYKCIDCDLPVGPRQQALQCDGCEQWQHRNCGTGITQSTYREAVRNGDEIDWRCLLCSEEFFVAPQLTSTPNASGSLSSTPPSSPSGSVPLFSESSLEDPAIGIVEPAPAQAVTYKVYEEGTIHRRVMTSSVLL